MENIFQPNEEFNFSQLSLAHPSGIQGGAYFTKIQMNNNKEETINVFSKLKKQTTETINLNNSYDEQQSLTLPEVKQEHIPINKKKENDPILPKTEIINQLNDMNAKIDKLYEIVSKLTNLIQDNTKIQDNTTEL